MGKLVVMPHQPLVSIDAIPLILIDSQLHVVLGVRDFEPFAGRAALPGVLLNANERIIEAVQRALSSKIGVGADAIEASIESGVFDDFERDVRGPTLSIARAVILKRDTSLDDSRVCTVPLSNIPSLPFDHASILKHAALRVLNSLWIDEPLTKALLGEKFDTAELIARINELSTASELPMPETANIGRGLRSNKRLTQVAPAALAVGRGRPPAVWTWVRD